MEYRLSGVRETTGNDFQAIVEGDTADDALETFFEDVDEENFDVETVERHI